MKNSSLKASSKIAEDNATVSRGNSREGYKTLKKGNPVNHSRKHLDGECPVIGVSIGTTLNMENYESLRADVWLTDRKHDDETLEQAYSRVASIVGSVLEKLCEEYKKD